MIEPVEILWQPAGFNLASLGSRALVDVTDGDTPNIRMPVRMLSVDTPEVIARTAARAAEIDRELVELAGWIRASTAPIGEALARHLLPRLDTGEAGSLQFRQGEAASAFLKERMEARLQRPGGRRRSLFIRAADEPFDDDGRLLAYLAPSFTATELAELPRQERATFNLDLVESGWAAPFVIYPSIPGELDLPLLLEAAVAAIDGKRGIWAEPMTLLAYEYRAVLRLHGITAKLVAGERLPPRARFAWRERYCADMRSRRLHGPEDWPEVPAAYRLWVWPRDVQDAIAKLNLVPAPSLEATG